MLSSALLNYANVNAGDVLLSLGDTDISSQIRAKEKEITAAQEKLTEAQTALANFNAVAPIDGTVTSCSLTPGQEVKSGDTVLTISNTTTMVVEITVDDRNISFVKPGMTVDLTDYNGNTFLGTVTNINMTPDMSNGTSGMTNYPVTLTVDNYDGTLLQGMWLDYSFVTSQSDNCIVIPSQMPRAMLSKWSSSRRTASLRTPWMWSCPNRPRVRPGSTPPKRRATIPCRWRPV